MQFKSKDGLRSANVAEHPFKEKTWCVYYVFPSGLQGMKSPFPSKRAATDWARGYVNDPANA